MKRLFSALLLLLMTSITAQANITFGIIPLEDKEVMTQKFTALAQYLSSQLGEPVTLQVGNDYNEIESGLSTGTIHIAYVGPSGAVKVNQKNPAVIPLVKVVKSGSPFYKSYVIAKKDSPLNSPADLKGKVFAFGDKGSTSSYLVPKYILGKNGVTLDDLKESKLTGSHSNVLKAVLDGSADAGGLKESLALKNADKVKFLEISKPIPNFPICANVKALGKEKAKKIQAVLVAMPDKSQEITAISKKYDKFDKASIADYQIIAAIMKKQ
ncbi:MAG: phosphate/phosphite/phosphonate ABC transporter substrate-binding protein [Thermodesulfobacteriota bacterium]|nr:phosphate/phosphite/phosphonate ABC transporter substrate-binding protein [Thermodesulfobacteriota bacterium]